jgi:hypothetical protein
MELYLHIAIHLHSVVLDDNFTMQLTAAHRHKIILVFGKDPLETPLGIIKELWFAERLWSANSLQLVRRFEQMPDFNIINFANYMLPKF